MQHSTNHNLKLMEATDNVRRQDFVDNFTALDNGISPFYVATESATNTYKVTTGANKTILQNGYSIRVAIPKNSTGAVSITVDSVTVPVKKPNGNAVTNFKQNGVYSLTYYNSVFILASGGVDDVSFSASDLLTGKSANDSNGEKVNGTMPNKGTVTQSLSANGSLTLPRGYYDSIKVTQSLTTKGATTWKPSTKAQSIPSGTYLTGTQTIQGDANLAPQNIRAGISIFGVGGALTIQSLSLIKSGSAIVAGAGSNLGTFTGGLKIIFTYEVATSNVYVSFFDPSARNGTLPFRLIKNNADLFDTSTTTNIHGSVYWYWYNNELLINRGSASKYDGKEFKYKIFDLGYTMSSIKSF